MARPRPDDFDNDTIKTPVSATPGSTPISYAANVNRQKTKKWTQAKTVDYGGDDWGEDDYEYEPEPPVPKPTGLRQAGQAATGGPGSASQDKKSYGSLPAVPGDASRSVTNPVLARSNSFDRGDEKRAFSSSQVPSSAVPDTAAPSAATTAAATASVPAQVVQPPSASAPAPSQHNPQPALHVQTRQPSVGLRKPVQVSQPVAANSPVPMSTTSTTSKYSQESGFNNETQRRDFSPSSIVSPLQSRTSGPTAQTVADAATSRFPPRKSSISTGQPDLAAILPTSEAPKPWAEQPTSPSSSKSSTTTKALPFIRPADIYKRHLEEQAEKQRQSLDSSRPSMDSAQGKNSDRSASPARPIVQEERMSSVSSGSSSVQYHETEPFYEAPASYNTRGQLMPVLEPVIERKSEYGFDSFNTAPLKSPADPSSQHGLLSKETDANEIDQQRRFSTSPKLPDLNRMSGFGMDMFFQSTPEKAPPLPTMPTVEESKPKAFSTLDQTSSSPETNLKSQPSLGFTSAVHQAFDSSLQPQTPASETGSGVKRTDSESTGTTGISPIISRVSSTTAAESRARDAENRDRDIPVITEAPEPSSRRSSALAPEGVPARKATPDQSRSDGLAFQPGHRRDTSTPSPNNSPARTPQLANMPQVTGGESAHLSEISTNASTDDDELAPPRRPFAGEREESFRPTLPGDWISYASLASEKPENTLSSGESQTLSATPAKENKDVEPSSATTASTFLKGGVIGATGAALGGAAAALIGRSNSPDTKAGADIPRALTPGAKPPSRALTPDNAMAPAGNPYETSTIDPRLGGQAAALQTSSAAPTPALKDSQQPQAETPRDSLYITPIAPLRQKSPERVAEEDSLAPPMRPQMLPTLSTAETAQDDESDRLRKEIIKSLSPKPSDINSRSIEAESSPIAAEGEYDGARESMYLPSEYDNYWADTGDEAEVPEVPQHIKQEPAVEPQSAVSALTSSDVPRKSTPPVDNNQAPSPVIAPLNTSKAGESRPAINAQHRFSWEAPSEDVSAAPSTSSAADEQKTNLKYGANKTFASPADALPPSATVAFSDPAAPFRPSSNVTSPVSQTQGSNTPPPYDDEKMPVAADDEHSSTLSTTTKVAGIAAGGVGALAAASWATSRDSTEAPAYTAPESNTQKRLSIAEEKSPANASTYSIANTPPEAEHPAHGTQALSSPVELKQTLTTSSEAPGISYIQGTGQGASDLSKVTPFRDILAMASAEQRINSFNESRYQFSLMDSGLGDWLASLKTQHPETVPFGASPGLNNTARSRTPKTGTSTPLQQPYYQQYLNASSPTSGTPPATPRPTTAGGGLSGGSFGQQSSGFSSSGPKLSGHQVQAKGKELLSSAGKFGGFASKAGKGLLAKGKTKFRGGNTGDKTSAEPNSNQSSISTSAPNQQTTTTNKGSRRNSWGLPLALGRQAGRTDESLPVASADEVKPTDLQSPTPIRGPPPRLNSDIVPTGISHFSEREIIPGSSTRSVSEVSVEDEQGYAPPEYVRDGDGDDVEQPIATVPGASDSIDVSQPKPISKSQPSWDGFNATPIAEEEGFQYEAQDKQKSLSESAGASNHPASTAAGVLGVGTVSGAALGALSSIHDTNAVPLASPTRPYSSLVVPGQSADAEAVPRTSNGSKSDRSDVYLDAEEEQKGVEQSQENDGWVMVPNEGVPSEPAGSTARVEEEHQGSGPHAADIKPRIGSIDSTSKHTFATAPTAVLALPEHTLLGDIDNGPFKEVQTYQPTQPSHQDNTYDNFVAPAVVAVAGAPEHLGNRHGGSQDFNLAAAAQTIQAGQPAQQSAQHSSGFPASTAIPNDQRYAAGMAQPSEYAQRPPHVQTGTEQAGGPQSFVGLPPIRRSSTFGFSGFGSKKNRERFPLDDDDDERPPVPSTIPLEYDDNANSSHMTSAAAVGGASYLAPASIHGTDNHAGNGDSAHQIQRQPSPNYSDEMMRPAIDTSNHPAAYNRNSVGSQPSAQRPGSASRPTSTGENRGRAGSLNTSNDWSKQAAHSFHEPPPVQVPSNAHRVRSGSTNSSIQQTPQHGNTPSTVSQGSIGPSSSFPVIDQHGRPLSSSFTNTQGPAVGPSYPRPAPQVFNQPPSSAQRYPDLFKQEQPLPRAPVQDDNLPPQYYQGPVSREEAFLPRQQTAEYSLPGVGPDERQSHRNSGSFFKEIGGRISRATSRDRSGSTNTDVRHSPVRRSDTKDFEKEYEESSTSVASEDMLDKVKRRSSFFGSLSRTSTGTPTRSRDDIIKPSTPQGSHPQPQSQPLQGSPLAQPINEKRRSSFFGLGSSASKPQPAFSGQPQQTDQGLLGQLKKPQRSSTSNALGDEAGKKKRFSGLTSFMRSEPKAQQTGPPGGPYQGQTFSHGQGQYVGQPPFMGQQGRQGSQASPMQGPQGQQQYFPAGPPQQLQRPGPEAAMMSGAVMQPVSAPQANTFSDPRTRPPMAEQQDSFGPPPPQNPLRRSMDMNKQGRPAPQPAFTTDAASAQSNTSQVLPSQNTKAGVEERYSAPAGPPPGWKGAVGAIGAAHQFQQHSHQTQAEGQRHMQPQVQRPDMQPRIPSEGGFHIANNPQKEGPLMAPAEILEREAERKRSLDLRLSTDKRSETSLLSQTQTRIALQDPQTQPPLTVEEQRQLLQPPPPQSQVQREVVQQLGLQPQVQGSDGISAVSGEHQPGLSLYGLPQQFSGGQHQNHGPPSNPQSRVVSGGSVQNGSKTGSLQHRADTQPRLSGEQGFGGILQPRPEQQRVVSSGSLQDGSQRNQSPLGHQQTQSRVGPPLQGYHQAGPAPVQYGPSHGVPVQGNVPPHPHMQAQHGLGIRPGQQGPQVPQLQPQDGNFERQYGRNASAPGQQRFSPVPNGGGAPPGVPYQQAGKGSSPLHGGAPLPGNYTGSTGPQQGLGPKDQQLKKEEKSRRSSSGLFAGILGKKAPKQQSAPAPVRENQYAAPAQQPWQQQQVPMTHQQQQQQLSQQQQFQQPSHVQRQGPALLTANLPPERQMLRSPDASKPPVNISRAPDQRQDRGRQPFQEPKYDPTPIPGAYGVVRGEQGIRNTGAKGPFAQQPQQQQQIPRGMVPSQSSGFGQQQGTYNQPQQYADVLQPPPNLPIGHSREFGHGEPVQQNARQSPRVLSKEELVARSPARKQFGQQAPYQLSLPDEDKRRERRLSNEETSAEREAAAAAAVRVSSDRQRLSTQNTQAGDRSMPAIHTATSSAVHYPMHPATYPLPDSTFSPINPQASHFPAPPLPSNFGSFASSSLHPNDQLDRTLDRSNTRATHASEVSQLSGSTTTPQPGIDDNHLRPVPPDQQHVIGNTGTRSESITPPSPGGTPHLNQHNTVIPSDNAVSPPETTRDAVSPLAEHEAERMRLGARQLSDDDIYNATPLVSRAKVQPPFGVPPVPALPGQAAPQIQTNDRAISPPSPNPNTSNHGKLATAGAIGVGAATGAAAGTTIATSDTRGLGNEGLEPIQNHPEEKIWVGGSSNYPGDAFEMDADPTPVMSATSYPGMEWNPYGAGAWDED